MNDRQIRDVMQKITSHISGQILNLSSKLKDNIVSATPVDTGFAAGSWIDIDNGLTANYKFPHRLIVSSCYYIQLLEHGHSRQAPSGMVRISLSSLVNANNFS